MKSFTINMTDDSYDRIIDKFSLKNDYPSQVINDDGNLVDNPETKEEFVLRHVKKYLTNEVATYETKVAADSARQDVLDSLVFL